MKTLRSAPRLRLLVKNSVLQKTENNATTVQTKIYRRMEQNAILLQRSYTERERERNARESHQMANTRKRNISPPHKLFYARMLDPVAVSLRRKTKRKKSTKKCGRRLITKTFNLKDRLYPLLSAFKFQILRVMQRPGPEVLKLENQSNTPAEPRYWRWNALPKRSSHDNTQRHPAVS